MTELVEVGDRGIVFFKECIANRFSIACQSSICSLEFILHNLDAINFCETENCGRLIGKYCCFTPEYLLYMFPGNNSYLHFSDRRNSLA
jgi:hypothetical protein